MLEHLKVIIVGGSVAGLTLAHALEKLGVSYQVLEKSDEISPQIGASIGILPNGARILDQLNVLEALEKKVEPLKTARIYYPDGYSFDSSFLESWNKTFGYSAVFLERQSFLAILFDKLKHKNRVHTGERVLSICYDSSSHVVVKTATGNEYAAHLVVGADGVYSTVRSEMWRLAEESGIPVQDAEIAGLKLEYACIYGISANISALDAGVWSSFLDKNFALHFISAAGHKVFWFLIFKPKSGQFQPERRHFTVEETRRVCEDLASKTLCPNLTFGDLWSNCDIFKMTPLEEGHFNQWQSRRLAIMGDAVRKMAPNMGQGANMAIEDAASLANELSRAGFGRAEMDTAVMEERLCKALGRYGARFQSRTRRMCRMSEFLVRLQASDGWLNGILVRHVVPMLHDAPAWISERAIMGGPCFEFVDVPKRSRRSMGASGASRGLDCMSDGRWLLLAVVAGAIAMALCFTLLCSKLNGSWAHFKVALQRLLMSFYASTVPLAWPSLGMIAAAALLVVFLHERLSKSVNAPCVGPVARFSKWPAALLNLRFARESIQEGYSKYGTKFFQIPTIRRWEVYICDPDMLRQYRNVGDQHLSMIAAMSEEFQFEWTSPGGQYDAHRLGTPVMTKALRWQRLRTTTANDPFFSGFAATCAHALDQGIRTLGKPQQPAAGSVDGSGWVSVPCFTLALSVVSQLTSKSLFGQSDFWDDAAFLHLCRAYADSVPKYAMLLHLVPSLLRETVAELLPVRKFYWKITGIICQEIRQRKEAQKGSRTKAPPGDLLDFGIHWVQDAKHAGNYEDIHVSNLMSFTVFAALHTTSQLITLSIYELAARPEYMQPLRDEVERCMAEHGAWTKASIDAMHILDSFMKETQRCNVLNASSLERIALKPFTFSNGLHIPKGVWIGTPHSPLFQDERLYADPGRFDGMRFARQRLSADAQVRRKCSLTSTSEHSMHFGYGRHTCPGRWMAADEAKLVMARLIFGYDIALFGPRPPNVRLLKFNVPNMTANIWLRERSTVQHD